MRSIAKVFGGSLGCSSRQQATVLRASRCKGPVGRLQANAQTEPHARIESAQLVGSRGVEDRHLAHQTNDLIGDRDLRRLADLARVTPRLDSLVTLAGAIRQIGARAPAGQLRPIETSGARSLCRRAHLLGEYGPTAQPAGRPAPSLVRRGP